MQTEIEKSEIVKLNTEILQWIRVVQILTTALSAIGKTIDGALMSSKETMPR